MHHETVSMEEAMAARKVLIEVLRTQGLFPGPMHPTLMRNVRIDSEMSDPPDHFIRVVLPVAEDVSDIPTEVNGVRVFIVQEDRRWIAEAL
jgi:hypothetical protein